uniref:Uncharacterized protein n=1 Tax=Amphilophus citrinellus TaxID=61819 RepID=A0A3Q0SZZ5_AMPCI
MAPKDPLLGSLKVCVLNLQSDGETLTDSNPHLASCCELLELVLRKGLQQPVLSLVHRDYWHCFEQLPHQDTCGSLSALSLAVEQTRVCRKLLSAQGRGRYLLRLALSRKVLPQFFTHLLHTARLLEWYSPDLSILRNEEFMEPFLSLLLVLSHMDFKLDMENCSFLDESWLLPVCEMYEVVPCRELGLVLRYLSGRVFVLDLMPGSQADVDRFVCPGDIIDEINGTSLRNSKSGHAGVVLSRFKGCPLSIRIIRWRAHNGTVYRPLIKFLRELRTENPTLHLGPASSLQAFTLLPRDDGDAIYKPCHWLDPPMSSKHTIGCVHRDSPETPQSTGFCCVALRASSIKECEDIVCRIATGFKHTEWFV